MKHRKTLTILITLALLVCMLAGCGKSEPAASSPDPATAPPASDSAPTGEPVAPDAEKEPAEAVDKTVVFNCNDGDPGTLDPFAATSSARTVCLMQVYDRLCEYNENDEMVGVMAKSWSQEGRVVSIELYDNIVDTAGNHFTASDAIFSIQRAGEAGNSNALVFDAMEVVDDYNFTLTLKNDTVNAFNDSVTYLYMVTEAAYEASGGNMSMNPVTTGAFTVLEYETGATITLVKNENYWQDASLRKALIQQQNCDKIVYNLMTEASQVIVGLESGVIDAAMCDFGLASRFEDGGDSADAGIDLKTIATWGGNALYFNHSASSVFQDNLALRQSILYAIDREALLEAVFDGNAINPCCYGQLRYNDANPAWETQDYFNYNPELSAKYFEESGYASGELTLRLIYPSSSYCDTMADVIQAYLGILGINVEINGLQSAIYSEYIKDETQWDIAFIGKGGSGSITRIWNAMLNRDNYSGGKFAAGILTDDTLQELVVAAGTEGTHSRESVDAVQQYLIDNAINMQLYVEAKCVAYNTANLVEPCTNVDARWVPGASTYTWG